MRKWGWSGRGDALAKVTRNIEQPTAISPSLDAVAQSQRAEWRIALYERHAALAAEQVTGLSKWLTASLFAANSGGLITLLNQSEKVVLPIWAGGFFIAGLIFALLSATANQELYNRASEPLLDLIGYWQEVKITGVTHLDEHEKIKESLKDAYRWSWIGPSLGWLSGLAFIGGTVFTAIGLGR